MFWRMWTCSVVIPNVEFAWSLALLALNPDRSFWHWRYILQLMYISDWNNGCSHFCTICMCLEFCLLQPCWKIHRIQNILTLDVCSKTGIAAKCFVPSIFQLWGSMSYTSLFLLHLSFTQGREEVRGRVGSQSFGNNVHLDKCRHVASHIFWGEAREFRRQWTHLVATALRPLRGYMPGEMLSASGWYVHLEKVGHISYF